MPAVIPTNQSPAPAYGSGFARYTDPEFCTEFLADMARISPFQRQHPRGITTLQYDPSEYDFRSLVGDTLAAAGMIQREELAARGDRLELLHEIVAPNHQTHDRSQQSAAARVLYEMPAAFSRLYARLLEEVVLPQIDVGPSHAQITPTFRVFFPKAGGYPGATSYHNDLMIGHNPREVNVFVPLVPCAETRSLLFAELPESLELLRHYGTDMARFGHDTQHDQAVQQQLAALCQPLQLEVGQLVVFDSRCLHAGPANRTSLTRVTFDARLLPVNDVSTQTNIYRGLGRQRASFVAGEYFSAAPLQAKKSSLSV
jgi:hypothetical protein